MRISGQNTDGCDGEGGNKGKLSVPPSSNVTPGGTGPVCRSFPVFVLGSKRSRSTVETGDVVRRRGGSVCLVDFSCLVVLVPDFR